MNEYLLNKTFADLFSESFFTLPLMIVCTIIFLIIGLRQWRNLGVYWIFIAYGICAIIQDVLAIRDLIMAGDLKASYRLLLSSALLFSMIEFVTFYIFFYTVFLNPGIRKKIFVVGISYTLLLLSILFYFVIAKKVDGSFIFYVYSVTTSFLILFPAFYYFYYLFTLPPTKNLAKERAFWINIGIIFIQGLLIPFYLLGGYIVHDTTWYKMYSINYLAYSVMFVLFSIGLLCKPKKEVEGMFELKKNNK